MKRAILLACVVALLAVAAVAQEPPFRFPDGSIAPAGCPKACPTIWVPFKNSDPAGPTVVCVHPASPGPIYNCLGYDVIDKIVREQSREYLEREAAKLAPLPIIDKKRLSPA